MPLPDAILYLTEADVQRTLTVAEIVDLAETGLQADAAGRVAGDKFYMAVGEEGFIKPFSGYLGGEELVFDAETGLPVCLMEGGWITAAKTGASMAVTAAWLANPQAMSVTIFGAGTLGRMHLRGLACRFPLGRVFVVDVLPEVAEAYASELGPELGLPVEAVPLAERERAMELRLGVSLACTTG